MLLAMGADFTSRPQAGFTDLGQGTFDGGPEFGDLLEKEFFG